jgi:hypothetical protein
VVADDSDIPAAAGYVLNGVFRGVGESNGNGRPDESDRLLAGVGGRSADSAAEPALDPLPKRVRQASLAAELRESRGGGGGALPHDDSDAEPDRRASGPGRSAATVGAFQRQSRLARLAEDGEPPLTRPSSDTEQTREED